MIVNHALPRNLNIVFLRYQFSSFTVIYIHRATVIYFVFYAPKNKEKENNKFFCSLLSTALFKMRKIWGKMMIFTCGGQSFLHVAVFHMVNSVTCMNVGTSLEKANK